MPKQLLEHRGVVSKQASSTNVIIADLFAGLNIEQRKRLSIGVELVAKPELLMFLGMSQIRHNEMHIANSDCAKTSRRLVSTARLHGLSARCFESSQTTDRQSYVLSTSHLLSCFACLIVCYC